jgi:hypothetical protein
LEVRDKLTETHRGIRTIRDVREQLTNLSKRTKDDPDVTDAAKAIDKKLTAVEEALYQTKAKSPQDVLNFPREVTGRQPAPVTRFRPRRPAHRPDAVDNSIPSPAAPCQCPPRVTGRSRSCWPAAYLSGDCSPSLKNRAAQRSL